jgi:indolepyruvate ferredoxin oxidoreductase beta subunit
VAVSPQRITQQTNHVSVPTNVLVVGVGGQGVIMISKVLAQLCQLQGYQVKQSEVHGMAKRGGVVFSHVRFGVKVWSPTIPLGEADILLALEWAEGQRWLPYLNQERGKFIADIKQIPPPFAYRERKRGAQSRYNPESVAELTRQFPNSIAINATGMATTLGNERVANTILLGALSTSFSFPKEDWLAVLKSFVPPKTVQLNCLAFERGWEWAQSPQVLSSGQLEVQTSSGNGVAHVESLGQVTLEIIEAWCKGCDICVKMCPERCLILNHRQVAELTDPLACTGCRICEMLCPDLAIKVRM